jgi:hypothetical protein
MSKIPDKPQDIFIPLIEDYQRIFENDLVSLIIYGSAADGHYIKGQSDINLLVVLTPQGARRLEDAFETVKQWRKRNVAVPWVMTKFFIERSLDVYPIEFLNLKHNHIVLYGEDVLETLDFKPEDLRLQIERELKGKLILLREGYLETGGEAKPLRLLMTRSITAFISVFKALVYLKQHSVPTDRRKTIKELSQYFDVDANIFLQCIDMKEGKDTLSSKDVAVVFKKYLQEVEKICDLVDAVSR